MRGRLLRRGCRTDRNLIGRTILAWRSCSFVWREVRKPCTSRSDLGYHAAPQGISRCPPLSENFLGAVQWHLASSWHVLFGGVAVFATVGCAEGTGKALTPILPTVTTRPLTRMARCLKATLPQPSSPRSATRITNLTPTLRLANAAGTFDSSVPLSYVFQVFEGATLIVESDPIAAGSPETIWNVPANLLKLNKTYAWRARATYAGVDWDLVRQCVVPNAAAAASRWPGRLFEQCRSRHHWVRRECLSAISRLDGRGQTAAWSGAITTWSSSAIASSRPAAAKASTWARNFKRGTPVISHDFIVLRQPGQRDRGVDIASGFDDVNQTAEADVAGIWARQRLRVPVLRRLPGGGLLGRELGKEEE